MRSIFVPLLVGLVACGGKAVVDGLGDGGGGSAGQGTSTGTTHVGQGGGGTGATTGTTTPECGCRTPDNEPWPPDLPYCERRCNGDNTEWYDDCGIVQYVVHCPGTCKCTPPDCSGYVECV